MPYEPMFSCYHKGEMEIEDTFDEQAPNTRAANRYMDIAPPRQHGVRSDLAMPSMPEEEFEAHIQKYLTDPNAIYRGFTKTGKFATRRTQGHYKFIHAEIDVLLVCYKHGLQLGAKGSAYRDAVIDAMVEVIDDYGLDPRWNDLLAATEGHPMCQMWRLFGFYFVCSTVPIYFSILGTEHKELERCWKDELEKLPKGNTTREVWEEFLVKGRCRFHEHAEGDCWRQKKMEDGLWPRF